MRTTRGRLISKKRGNIKGNYRAIYLGLGGLVLASSLGKLILANHLATAGEEITRLEERATQLESRSYTLRNEIASHSSLRSVLEGALELGMGSGGEHVDILSPASLASR